MSQFAPADMQTHPVHPGPIPLQLRLQKPTTNTGRKSTGWSQVRAQLKDWAKPALTALIKDLYDASAANRDFLHARFQAEETGGVALEAYRRKVIEQFFPKRGFGKLKLAEARKAIRDYRKATGNVAGTVGGASGAGGGSGAGGASGAVQFCPHFFFRARRDGSRHADPVVPRDGRSAYR